MATHFIPIELAHTVDIRRMYSLYYFCFASGHVFPGETHDFWELVYVNSGELDVTAGQTELVVGQGHVILHKPNEFHRFIVTMEQTSIFVTGFECHSPELLRLCKGSIKLDVPEKKLLAALCHEGELCFGPTMDSAYLVQLEPLSQAPFASLQLIRLYLEHLLIMLLRDDREEHTAAQQGAFLTDEESEETLLKQITAYMEAHLDGSLDFEQVRQQFNMSATSLKNLFSSQTGMGVIEYYQRLRVDESRRLLRTGAMNITQISEHLGYSSIHTFSRQFKRLMHMSPTDYLKSIHYIPLSERQNGAGIPPMRV